MARAGWRSLNLNEDQRTAVEHRGGPLIVLAGPGTGKTRVIIARVARLLEEGSRPESIVALTFTVKAAQEMRGRLSEVAGASASARVGLGTFHSFGARLVARFSDELGLPARPLLADSSQERALIARVIEDEGLFPGVGDVGRETLVDRCKKFVSMCRQHGRFPEDAIRHAESWERELRGRASGDPDVQAALDAERETAREFGEHARAYACYEAACRREGVLTIDEYLTLPIRLMRERARSATVLRGEVRHVVVDEFQDVNGSQIEMLRLLAPPRGGGVRGPDIAVVGDDDQSIYAFRGSSQRAFERFEEVWEAVSVLELRDNYRCAAPIQRVSSVFIERTAGRFKEDKTLRCGVDPARDEKLGGTPAVEGVTLTDEALYAQTILGMMHADRQRERESGRPARPWGSYGVIARNHSTLQQVAREFELAEVPFRYAPGEQAGEEPAVEDLLALLRLVSDPTDAPRALALLRRPPLSAPWGELAHLHARYRKESKWGVLSSGFPEWLSAQSGGDVACGRAGRMLSDWLAELRDLDARATPDEVAMRAVELGGWATLAPGEGGDAGERAGARARRVSALARALQFIHARVARLAPPYNMNAFWSYFDRLDEGDKAMQSLEDDRLGDDREEAEGAPDAVTLLTAHKAKGLEFDTVFVLRVRPAGEFPGPRRSESGESDGIAHLLPAAFTLQPEEDDPSEDRRLFYVAMTRAQRRLVLMAKAKKTRTKAEDYFDEVLRDTEGAETVIRSSDEVIGSAGGAGEGAVAMEAIERRLAGAREIPRRLRDAHRQTVEGIHSLLAQLEQRRSDVGASASSLGLAGRRLAFLGALRDGGGADPALLDPSDRAWGEELCAALGEAPAPPVLFEPMQAPLELSYTRVSDYLRCPRCFYAKHVLRLPEPAGVAMTHGTIVHAALEEFFQEYRQAAADSRLPPGEGRLLELGRAGVRRSRLPAYLLDALDERTLDAMLKNALRTLHEAGERAGFELLELEVKFPPDFELPIATPNRVSGRIDRIDRAEAGGSLRYRIVDYKTGKGNDSLLRPQADNLQLGIYSMAASVLFGNDPLDPLPGTAEYWVLSSGESGSIDLAALDLRGVLERVGEAAAGMTAGRFEVSDACRKQRPTKDGRPPICRLFGPAEG